MTWRSTLTKQGCDFVIRWGHNRPTMYSIRRTCPADLWKRHRGIFNIIWYTQGEHVPTYQLYTGRNMTYQPCTCRGACPYHQGVTKFVLVFMHFYLLRALGHNYAQEGMLHNRVQDTQGNMSLHDAWKVWVGIFMNWSPGTQGDTINSHVPCSQRNIFHHMQKHRGNMNLQWDAEKHVPPCLIKPYIQE